MPDSPKHPNGPRAANALGRYGPRALLGTVALGGIYFYMSAAPPKPEGTYVPNPMKTPGVRNIEGAYQRGGATSTHTKAYGGTPQGQKTDITRENAASDKPKGFSEGGMGDEQRSASQTKGKIGDTWSDMKYGDSRDK